MIGKRLNSQRRASKRLPATSLPTLRNHCRYRQRVLQQPQERSRKRPGSTPTSWAIAGRDPHVGQYLRSHRSSSRQPSKAFTRGAEEPCSSRPRQITQQPGEQRSERLVAQQKVRNAARDWGSRRISVSRARVSAASHPDDVPEASFSRSAPAIRPPGSRSTAAEVLGSSGTPARKSAR